MTLVLNHYCPPVLFHLMTIVAEVFYLGGSAGVKTPRPDPRRRRMEHEQSSMYSILTWGREQEVRVAPPSPKAPEAPKYVPLFHVQAPQAPGWLEKYGC